MDYDVIIVGGGAAGLSAAYELASKNSKLKITIIEKARVVGKKLSASGNGKCNLTNARFGKEHYYSQDDSFVQKWSEKHGYQEIVQFFEQMGILLYEKNGYYYPFSNQAKQVTDYLYNRCVELHVKFQLETVVLKIIPVKDGYELHTMGANKQILHCKYVILATGGMAAPKLGGTDLGYQISKQLSLQVQNIYPALTPAYIKDPDLKIAKGVRCDATVTLKDMDGTLKKEYGQLQINEDSLSGIAMMNLSCRFNALQDEQRKECIYIDFFPAFSWEQLKEYVEHQIESKPQQMLIDMLNGILPSRLNYYILKRLHMKDELKLIDLTGKQLNKLISNIKKMTFTPIMRMDYDRAQVTAGGVAVTEIVEDRFESRKYKNLFLVGELLDVTGECGGYNITFAILSALQATNTILNQS